MYCYNITSIDNTYREYIVIKSDLTNQIKYVIITTKGKIRANKNNRFRMYF